MLSVDVKRVRDRRAALDGAARWYRIDKSGPRRLAPSHLVRKLNKIEKNARRLLRSLGIPDAESAADGPVGQELAEALTLMGERDSSPLLRACERLDLLTQLLERIRTMAEMQSRAAAAASELRHVGKLIVPPGHQGDRAANDWVATMMSIYRDIMGRDPRISVGGPAGPNRGVAGGPLIRFLQAAGEPLHIAYSPEAWAKRVRLILRQANCRN